MAMTAIIRPRRDTKANLNTANPILKEGEMVVEFAETIGVGKPGIKFGKVGGATRYNDTGYAVAPITSKLKSELDSSNPVLLKSEIGIGWIDKLDSGACVVRIGDGTTAWKSLKDYETNQVTYTSTEISNLKTQAAKTTTISDSLWPAHGDTLNDLAGKDVAFKTTMLKGLGYARLDALAAKLSGLSNKDFMGIMEFINDKKFDKANVYNGLDSTNTGLALSAAAGNSLSTKLGTGNLPTGMNNVVDGLTQLNSNMGRKMNVSNSNCSGTLTVNDSSKSAGNRSDNEWSEAAIAFMDKNRFRMAYLQPMLKSDGTVDLHINTGNGSVYINGTKIG